MSGFTFNRGHATIDPDIRTPYVTNWTLGYQRESVADSGARDPLRREPRHATSGGATTSTRRTSSRTASCRNSGTRSATSQSTWQRADELRQPRAAGTSRAADLRGRVRAAGFEASRAGRRERLHQRHVHHATAAGTGRPAREHAGGGGRRVSLPLSRWSAARCRAAPAAATTRRDRIPSTSSRPTPSAAGSNMRQLTDESSSEYDSLQLQFRKRYSRAVSRDRQLHLRQVANRSLPRRRRRPAELPHAARQGTRLGPDGVRSAAHLPDATGPTICRLAKDRAFSIDSARPRPDLRRLVGVRRRPDPDWPSVPAHERPPDPQSAGRRRRPERHHRRRAASRS